MFSDHRMCAKLAIYMIYNLDYHWILPFPFLLLHKQAPQVTKYIRLTTQTEKCFKGYKTVIATELKTNLFLWKVHPAGGGPLAAACARWAGLGTIDRVMSVSDVKVFCSRVRASSASTEQLRSSSGARETRADMSAKWRDVRNGENNVLAPSSCRKQLLAFSYKSIKMFKCFV